MAFAAAKSAGAVHSNATGSGRMLRQYETLFFSSSGFSFLLPRLKSSALSAAFGGRSAMRFSSRSRLEITRMLLAQPGAVGERLGKMSAHGLARGRRIACHQRLHDLAVV